MMHSNSMLKNRKISSGESCDSPVDIISNMPDSILSQILSFLPTTKEAVNTSVLSKRWKYLWTYVDKLRFDSDRLLAKGRKRLPRSVYEVLKAHQGNIKAFSLCGRDVGYNELDFTSWINTVVSRGIEIIHFDISFPDEKPNWPLSIFSCTTLVDLKIYSLDGNSMDIPSTPIFPCLKKLEVTYFDSGFCKSIVSRCLALEHLVAGFSNTPFEIVSSSMKRLDLHCPYMGHIMAFCVPSLEYLKLVCRLPFQLIAGQQLSSLIEADISFREENLRYSRHVNAKELRDSFQRFIHSMSNVKFLRIQSRCSKFFNSVGHCVFVNLTKLEINSSFFEWRLLLSFMENSINLEVISLVKTSTCKKHKLAWKEPKKVPTSLSSSLRKISIHGYSEDELPMVMYVLRTAQILEQVDIHCAMCFEDDNDWKYDMLQKLQKLDRVSKRCELFLV